MKPNRLLFSVDQLVILAGNDGDGHCQGGVILMQGEGGGDQECRLGSAGAKL